MHPSRKRSARAAVDVVTIALFLAAILAPTVDLLVRDDGARGPERENRKMRPRPDLPGTLPELTAFPSAYEGHFADSFGLRDVLLGWNSREKILLFGTSPAPIVVIADDGWIDYGGEESMEVLRGVRPMTMTELIAWQRHFERCRAFCERNGAQYLFLICPNKETIYPEHVPARFEKLGPTRLEQLVKFLPSELRGCIVDPRAALLAAKAHDEPPADYLYNVSGTHWNGRGTWAVYQALMRAMQRIRPEMQALPEGAATFPPYGFPSGDSWGEHLYARDLFPHPSRQIVLDRPQVHETIEDTRGSTSRWHTRNESVRGPRLLVFHDSFGPSLGEALAESCPDLTLASSWFDTQQILIEQPEVVLEVRVERVFRVPPIVDDMGGLLDLAEDVAPQQGGRVVVALDASSPDHSFPTSGEARVERTADGLVFRAETATAAWLLPAFTVAEGERAWLHVELESQSGGTLIAYRRANETGQWLRHDAGYMPYAPGKQARTIALHGPSGKRELRLHLFGPPEQVLVKKLEVRVTGR